MAAVRIEQVAQAAGVSIKTVSRVFNGEPSVRQQTRARVQEAAEKLGYRPNLAARRLRSQRSYLVALAYDEPSRHFLSEIQSGVLQACHAGGFNLVLAPLRFGEQSDIRVLSQHSPLEGIVLLSPLTEDRRLLTYLAGKSIRVASISPRNNRGRIGVAMDERAAVRELIGHLVALGHRRIGYINGHSRHAASAWRQEGYKQALQDAGIAYDRKLVMPGEFTFESGVKGACHLLDLAMPPTAIFAANDDMAAGVIRVARLQGLSVPADLSVCGFDDTPLSHYIYPSLTTVCQPARLMGQIATEELLRELANPGSGKMRSIEYDLQLRQSTARAPVGNVRRRYLGPNSHGP